MRGHEVESGLILSTQNDRRMTPGTGVKTFPVGASCFVATWARTVRGALVARSGNLVNTMREAPPEEEGKMHPNRLLAALRGNAGRRRGHAHGGVVRRAFSVDVGS